MGIRNWRHSGLAAFRIGGTFSVCRVNNNVCPPLFQIESSDATRCIELNLDHDAIAVQNRGDNPEQPYVADREQKRRRLERLFTA